jgi:hypothetical protein
LGKWCKNKHGASKIIDTLETYQASWRPFSLKKTKITLESFKKIRRKKLDVDNYEIY